MYKLFRADHVCSMYEKKTGMKLIGEFLPEYTYFDPFLTFDVRFRLR